MVSTVRKNLLQKLFNYTKKRVGTLKVQYQYMRFGMDFIIGLCAWLKV